MERLLFAGVETPEDLFSVLDRLSRPGSRRRSWSRQSTRFVATDRPPPICGWPGTSPRRPLLMAEDLQDQLLRSEDSIPWGEFRTESHSESRTLSSFCLRDNLRMGKPRKTPPTEQKIRDAFAKRLAELCEDKFEVKKNGLTQTDLGKLLGVSQSMMSSYFKAKKYPSSIQAARMALVLECGTEYLLTGRGPKWLATTEAIDISGLNERQREAVRRTVESYRPEA